MELHTLGVNGGYTQDDVIAVARAFTGWTVYDAQKYAEFQFNPAGHAQFFIEGVADQGVDEGEPTG